MHKQTSSPAKAILTPSPAKAALAPTSSFYAPRWLWLLVLLVLVVFYLAISLGTYNLSLGQILSLLSQASAGDNSNPDYFTLVQYRLPRAILAILLGASLALGGVLVQAIIRNPLASPEILGINNGAGMAAVIMISFFPTLSVAWILPVAFVAGLGAFVVLWLVCGREFSTLKMALIGVALSALYSAVTHYVMLARPLEVNLAMLWLTGSLWGRSWFYVWLALPVVLTLFPLALLLGKDLNILALGETKAHNLGVNVRRTQLLTLLLAVAVSATAVAICGPIAFMGLVAPHVARRVFGGRHHVLIPASMLVGALILQLADLLARVIAPPIELPAGILTAVIGAPYFFFLLMRKPS